MITTGMSTEAQDDVEGLGYPFQDGNGTPYPLDDVMVRNETRTVGEIVKRINNGRYIMDPDFQRDLMWNISQQSKLIESCIMRIPLPVIYVAENSDGRITVVDGLQRLSTFKRFLSDEFRLAKIGNDHPLDGKRFSDLPIQLQERVEDTQLTLHILDRSAPERARLDIFERVNSGVGLTRQQMRNAIYSGAGTRWLSRMASHDSFLRATGRSLNPKTMRDREAINRFAAFHLLGWRSYDNGDMDGFLARGIYRLDSLDEEEIHDISQVFTDSMCRNYRLFGAHAFRRSLIEQHDDVRRMVLNIALFDVLSCLFLRISEDTVTSYGDRIRIRIVNLIKNKDFNNAIRYSTNSTHQVVTRFEMIQESCSEYFS